MLLRAEDQGTDQETVAMVQGLGAGVFWDWFFLGVAVSYLGI